MGKFYLEISKECAEYLRIRGVGEAQIMVVDDAPNPRRHKALLRALEEVTGVSAERIFSHERTRYTVLARTIYTHYAQIDGDGIERISNDLGRNRWATNFYLRDYYSKLDGDMEFRRADTQIAARLKDDPEWSPPAKEKPTASKRKRRRRKRRRQPQRRETKQEQRQQYIQLELFR